MTFHKEFGIDKQGMCDVGKRAFETQRTWHIQDDDRAVLRGQEAELPLEGGGW
jgi:hypothetical protein